jgi:hypothetical protein
MALKYYCDGCDKEVAYDDINLLDVSIKRRGTVLEAGGTYELCKRCADEIIRDSNPKNWTRAAMAAPKPAAA